MISDPSVALANRRQRLNLAFLLLQIVSVIAIANLIFFASIEGLAYFTPIEHSGRISVPFFEWLDLLASAVLLYAIYLVTRRITGTLPLIAGWLLFTCSMLDLLGDVRARLDQLWMWLTAEALFASNPFTPLWQAFPRFLWEPLLLALLLSGFALAREVNRLHGGRLVTKGRLVTLLALAVASILLSARYLGMSVIEFMESIVDHAEDGAPAPGPLISALTVAFWIIALPELVFHILFIATLRRAKKRLNLPPDKTPCEQCGYLLPRTTTGTCPECGRSGALPEETRSNEPASR